MNNNTNIIAFKAISNFIYEISNIFQKHKSLKLYSRLIKKTTFCHENIIEKHIQTFKAFCVPNRDSIKNKKNSFNPSKIEYSSRVYIDITSILNEADQDTSSAIWKHLLYISAIIDPAGKAKEILQENLKTCGSNESDFLNNIIDKVEKHIDPSANPMDAVNSIMKSGIFNELLGGMNNDVNNGQLDLGKLMGAVQKMIGPLSQQIGADNKQSDSNPLDMITKMMSMIGNIGNNDTPILNTKLDNEQPQSLILESVNKIVVNKSPQSLILESVDESQPLPLLPPLEYVNTND